jgi:hypothetical protein
MIALIDEAIEGGRGQKAFAAEQGWKSAASVVQFMQQHMKGAPWPRHTEKVKQANVAAVLADVAQHGQRNRKIEDIADEAGVDQTTIHRAIKKAKEEGTFTVAWQEGGLDEATVVSRRILDAAVESGEVPPVPWHAPCR